MDKKTKEISVFIDESGSFESDPNSSRYYMVCMVFHDQDVDLTAEIQKLDDSFDGMGLPADHCVHAGPLIRREKEYAGKTREERRGIFDIKEAFALFASRTEFVPDVEPSKYRLFQVADIACTLELVREKMSRDEGLSESEKVFFGGAKNLKKTYLKVLDRKTFA